MLSCIVMLVIAFAMPIFEDHFRSFEVSWSTQFDPNRAQSNLSETKHPIQTKPNRTASKSNQKSHFKIETQPKHEPKTETKTPTDHSRVLFPHPVCPMTMTHPYLSTQYKSFCRCLNIGNLSRWEAIDEPNDIEEDECGFEVVGRAEDRRAPSFSDSRSRVLPGPEVPGFQNWMAGIGRVRRREIGPLIGWLIGIGTSL